MSKKLAAAGAIGGAGATAAASGSLAVYESGSEVAANTSLETLPQSTGSQVSQGSDSATLLHKFKQEKWKKGDSSIYFGKDSAISNIGTFSNSESTDGLNNSGTFIPDNDYGTVADKTKSSLRIEVQRKEYQKNKGNGTLTWFGSFSHKNKGFVTYNTAEAKDKKLVLTGGFYFMERKDQNQQGSIKYHKEITENDNKYLDETNFDKYFPKPYWYTSYKAFRGLYWSNGGFIKGASDLKNICSSSDTCDDSSQSYHNNPSNKVYKWEGRGYQWYNNKCHYGPHGYGCDKIYDGSGDANNVSALQWYEYMYGKNHFDLELRTRYWYRGSWKQVS